MEDLPETITLGTGELRIVFDRALDLARDLSETSGLQGVGFRRLRPTVRRSIRAAASRGRVARVGEHYYKPYPTLDKSTHGRT